MSSGGAQTVASTAGPASTASSAAALDGSGGEFHVVKKAAGDRGPVVSKGSGLYYSDFTPHVSVGTSGCVCANAGTRPMLVVCRNISPEAES